MLFRSKSVSSYQLFALGITGGIIPCPAALVVLLSAFALHRIGLGFFLITAFSFGLAAGGSIADAAATGARCGAQLLTRVGGP